MTIPKFPDFLGVVLQSLKDGKEHAIQKGNNSIRDYVIKEFSLTDSDLKYINSRTILLYEQSQKGKTPMRHTPRMFLMRMRVWILQK